MAVYKYVTEERIDILQNGLVRFTQPSAFNDVFELNPYFKALADEEHIKLLSTKTWAEEKVNSIIEENYEKQVEKYPIFRSIPNFKAIFKNLMSQNMPLGKQLWESFLKLDKPEIRTFVLKIIQDSLDQTVGILSLTEECDNILMWAHYANNHKGFVIEFDEKHSFFDQRTKDSELRRQLRKVNYSQERPGIFLFDSKLDDLQNLDIFINKFIWNKSKKWEYEQEWRMIDVLEDCKNKTKKDGQDIHLFTIPMGCITGVVLGCKVVREIQKEITDLLKSNKRYLHIKLKQAIIDEKDYRLNII